MISPRSIAFPARSTRASGVNDAAVDAVGPSGLDGRRRIGRWSAGKCVGLGRLELGLGLACTSPPPPAETCFTGSAGRSCEQHGSSRSARPAEQRRRQDIQASGENGCGLRVRGPSRPPLAASPRRRMRYDSVSIEPRPRNSSAARVPFHARSGPGGLRSRKADRPRCRRGLPACRRGVEVIIVNWPGATLRPGKRTRRVQA